MKQPLFLSQVGFHAIRVVRYGKILSTWKLSTVCLSVYIFAIRYLPCTVSCIRIEQEMAGVYGIDEIKSILQHRASSCDMTGHALPCQKSFMARRIHNGCVGNRIESEGQDFSLALKTVSLGIATFTQFAFPALKPVSAAFMLSSNLDTITGALKQIYEKKIEKEAFRLDSCLPRIANRELLFRGSDDMAPGSLAEIICEDGQSLP